MAAALAMMSEGVESARGERADQSDIDVGDPIGRLAIRCQETGDIVAVLHNANLRWTYFDIVRRLETEWPHDCYLRISYEDRTLGRGHKDTLESLGLIALHETIELEVSQVPVSKAAVRDVAVCRETALSALNSINALHVFQLSRISEPPPAVMLVCRALGVIMRTGYQWSKIKKDLAKRRFLLRLVDCEKDHISDSQFRALQQYVEDPRFVPEQIADQAAAALSWWCIFVYKYAQVAATMKEYGIEYNQDDDEFSPRWIYELPEEEEADESEEELEEPSMGQAVARLPQISLTSAVVETDDEGESGRGPLALRSQETGEIVATLQDARPSWTYFDICRRLETVWPHENFLHLHYNGHAMVRGHAETLQSIGVDLESGGAELLVVATPLQRAVLHDVAAQREASAQALNQLARSDLEALNALSHPPAAVTLVYGAIGALLGIEGEEAIRQAVGSAGFVLGLVGFDKDHIPPENLATAARFVEDPAFTPSVTEGSASVALGLWCKFAVSYGRLAEQMRELGLEDFAIVATGAGAAVPATIPEGVEAEDRATTDVTSCVDVDDGCSEVANKMDATRLPALFPNRFAGSYGIGGIEAPRKASEGPRGTLRIRSTQTGHVVASFFGVTADWHMDDVRRKLRSVWPAPKCQEHFLSYRGRSLGIYSTLAKLGINPADPHGDAELQVTLVKLIDHNFILSLEECYKQFQYSKLYLSRITYKDLLELASMPDRPVAEVLVCQCVGILLGVGVEWEVVKARLWTMWDFAFVDRLLEHNERNITYDGWKALQPYVEHPGFAPYSIQGDAAFALGLWCVAVYNLGRQHTFARDFQTPRGDKSTVVDEV